MKEEDDAVESRSITDDGVGRASFNHANRGNYDGEITKLGICMWDAVTKVR